MAITELRKIRKNEVESLSEVMIKSDYKFDTIKIADIKKSDIVDFITNNIECFYVYLIDEKINGFAIAYNLKKAPNKYEFFKNYFSFIQKITLKFSNKFVNDSLKENDYIVDFIYFEKNCNGKYSMFLKYFEMEKLKNRSKNLFTHPQYLSKEETGNIQISFQDLALHNLVSKN